MTIDWDKDIECEKGEINHISPIVSSSGSIFYWVVMKCDIDDLQGASWTVKQDGTPIDPWMPRVYNAKRKPKTGEWWVFDSKRVNYFSGAMFLTGPDGVPIARGKPLYPLIKDPLFEE